MNNVADKIGHMLKQSDNRFPLSNANFSEGYVNAELKILVHLRYTDLVQEYVAFLEWEPSTRIDDARRNRQRNFVSEDLLVGEGHMVGDVEPSESKADGQKQAVFIANVELVKRPQGVVSASIRLEVVDHLYEFGPHSPQFADLIFFVSRRVRRNREARFFIGCRVTALD